MVYNIFPCVLALLTIIPLGDVEPKGPGTTFETRIKNGDVSTKRIELGISVKMFVRPPRFLLLSVETHVYILS